MSQILTRSQLAKIHKARLTLGAFGSKGYFDPSDLLGAYPKPFVKEAGTIGLWNCFDDEIVDSTLLDQSDNGNNGTISGAILSSESKFRESLKFDGSDDYIDFGNDSVFDLTDQITLEAWVKMNVLGTNGHILGKNTTTWVLETTTGNGWQFYMNSGSVKAYGGTVDTLWHYLVGTYDSVTAGLKVYLDGVEIATNSGLQAIVTSTDNVRAGRKPDNTDPLNGHIAGLRISNRAKTANEIHDTYHGVWGY